MDQTEAARRLDRLPISVSVTVCDHRMTLNELINWQPGTLLTFEHPAISLLTLRAAGRDIGTGEPVKVGANIGLRLKQVGAK